MVLTNFVLRSLLQKYMAKKSKYTYYPNATVTDELDGTVYNLGMTVETMSVEISGSSHPFYTGKEALVDTAGRIDKFKSREAAKQDSKAKKERNKNGKKKMSFEELMVQNAPQEDKKEEKKADKKVEAKAETKNEAKTEEHPKPKVEDAPKADEDTVKEEPKA